MRYGVAFMAALFAAAAVLPAALGQERKPRNPFAPANPVRDDARPGKVVMSNGEEYKGHVYTTREKRLKIFDIADKTRKDVPLEAVARIEVKIEEEGLEKEWRWKEEGSDVKIYTGHAYPWKKYVTTLTLLDGEKITGHLSGLIYVQTDNGTRKFLIHDKDKGERDEKLSDIVHIKTVELTRETKKPAGE